MPKHIEVDQVELESAIELVEENGPLPSLLALSTQVSETMGGYPPPYIVKSRIETWQIEVKTKSGRKRNARPSVDNPSPSPSVGRNMTIIYTPSGPCPYKLLGTDKKMVEVWVEKITTDGYTRNVWYSKNALAYYVRQFYDIFSPEYEAVREVINRLPLYYPPEEEEIDESA